MKIIFMGTPDFSVPCLQALYDAGHNVAAVFTQPDKACGRKQVLTPSAVKQAALKLGLNVCQPNTLRDGTALETINKHQPDLIVVVAYGKILPPEILTAAKYGCINVHASLLPKFRGASPIQSAILAGESETGVTTMQMDEGIDTGDIFLQTRVAIEDNDTAETLFEKLSVAGAELLLETIEKLPQGSITPQKQDDKNATHCTVLNRESGKIDASKSAVEIANLVRGLYPWPSAYFQLQNKKFKVYAAAVAGKTAAAPGTLSTNKDSLLLSCGDGLALSILEIQPEGKRRMPAKEFLNGFKLTEDLIIDC